jgi:hypothetical protein
MLGKIPRMAFKSSHIIPFCAWESRKYNRIAPKLSKLILLRLSDNSGGYPPSLAFRHVGTICSGTENGSSPFAHFAKWVRRPLTVHSAFSAH